MQRGGNLFGMKNIYTRTGNAHSEHDFWNDWCIGTDRNSDSGSVEFVYIMENLQIVKELVLAQYQKCVLWLQGIVRNTRSSLFIQIYDLWSVTI